jgi:hypothetical protein
MTEWDGDKYLDLYSGGDRLEVLPGHRLSWQVSGDFLKYLQINAELIPRSGHDSFLRNSFQFVTSPIKRWG